VPPSSVRKNDIVVAANEPAMIWSVLTGLTAMLGSEFWPVSALSLAGMTSIIRIVIAQGPPPVP